MNLFWICSKRLKGGWLCESKLWKTNFSYRILVGCLATLLGCPAWGCYSPRRWEVLQIVSWWNSIACLGNISLCGWSFPLGFLFQSFWFSKETMSDPVRVAMIGHLDRFNYYWTLWWHWVSWRVFWVVKTLLKINPCNSCWIYCIDLLATAQLISSRFWFWYSGIDKTSASLG